LQGWVAGLDRWQAAYLDSVRQDDADAVGAARADLESQVASLGDDRRSELGVAVGELLSQLGDATAVIDRVLGGTLERRHVPFEVLGALEFLVHRSEAQIGDLVYLPQALQHGAADVLRVDGASLGSHLPLDVPHQRRHLGGGRRTVGERGSYASGELGGIEGLDRSGALADHACPLTALVGRDADGTRLADPAAADRGPIVCRAAVDHAGLVGLALWATHLPSQPTPGIPLGRRRTRSFGRFHLE